MLNFHFIIQITKITENENMSNLTVITEPGGISAGMKMTIF